MKKTGSYEAKSKFSQILRAVSDGEEFLITNHGKPVAKLVPANDRTGRDAAEVIQDLQAFQTRSDGSDVGLDDVQAAKQDGRR